MMNNWQFIFETEARSAIKRNGIEDLLKFLHAETDFYTAPASTKYHGAEESGLVKHSLAVLENFWKVAPVFGYEATESNKESAAIACLFHDICKANFYKVSYRNVKDEETGSWYKAPYYTVDESLPYGSHGAKSVFLVMSHMLLTAEEAMAIHHHMGAYGKSSYEDCGKAYANSKLAWLVHLADEAATYIDKN